MALRRLGLLPFPHQAHSLSVGLGLRRVVGRNRGSLSSPGRGLWAAASCVLPGWGPSPPQDRGAFHGPALWGWEEGRAWGHSGEGCPRGCGWQNSGRASMCMSQSGVTLETLGRATSHFVNKETGALRREGRCLRPPRAELEARLLPCSPTVREGGREVCIVFMCGCECATMLT